jgi:archaellum component FlaF (FlaF/FlaG flagellin family)
LSFFDEADEPRTAQSSASRSRRPSGSGRGVPPDRQTIQVRRAIAAVVILIVAILVILGVHSCQVSARNSALRDYNNGVGSLIQRSDQTGQQLFNQLSSGSSSNNAANLQTQINQTRQAADAELSEAHGLNVPSEVSGAQQNLLLAMQMRRDGIANIADQIQSALNKATSQQAVNQIAAEMARFYASDVLFTDYTAPKIAGALNAAGITGESIASGQFLTDVTWLTPTGVASKLGASIPAAGSNVHVPPCACGHAMQSVSVAGTQLQTGTTNTIPASPPATFACTFTNDGQQTEHNVRVKVTVSGTSISGEAVQAQTVPGQTYTVNVTLSSAPPTGQYTVTATVEKVPGETVTTHNSQSFPVSFQ